MPVRVKIKRKNMYIAKKTFLSDGLGQVKKGSKHTESLRTNELYKKGGYFDLMPETKSKNLKKVK